MEILNVLPAAPASISYNFCLWQLFWGRRRDGGVWSTVLFLARSNCFDVVNSLIYQLLRCLFFWCLTIKVWFSTSNDHSIYPLSISYVLQPNPSPLQRISSLNINAPFSPPERRLSLNRLCFYFSSEFSLFLFFSIFNSLLAAYTLEMPICGILEFFGHKILEKSEGEPSLHNHGHLLSFCSF